MTSRTDPGEDAFRLRRAVDLTQAERAYRHAVDHEPHRVDAHLALAEILVEADRPQEAVRTLQVAIGRCPGQAKLYNRLGDTLRRCGKLAAATQAFQRATELDGNYIAALHNLGRARQDQGAVNEAIEIYRAVIARQPDCFEAYVNLGTALDEINSHVDAVACYRRAIALRPQEAAAHNNLAMALHESGRLNEAIAAYDTACQIAPRDAEMQFNRALLLIQTGQFESGWREYEWRWQVPGGPRKRVLGIPRWNGEPLCGRCLLVHAEQGLGDEIMFASCLPDVIALGARCRLTANPRLAALLTRSFPAATVVAVERGKEDFDALAAGADAEIPAGSLPRLLRRTWSEFPRRSSYLVADPQRRTEWVRRFRALGPGLKVGISWRGGRRPVDRQKRSIPLLEWRRLLSIEHAHFINLQYGDYDEEVSQAAAAGIHLHDWPDADALRDVDGLAAQVSALDLVVSVSNATVHLAGALGIPTRALLPAHTGWRWFHGHEDSPWYPSVRVLRQQEPGDWASVLTRVDRELNELAQVACQQPGGISRSCGISRWALGSSVGT